jgi:transcriptional regulator with XRE-family HTH domain
MAKSPGSSRTLANTLALRVQQLREQYGYSQERLAELANLPLSQIQDIEAGIELFLSPSVRQKLARVLKTRASVLKAVEKPQQTQLTPYLSPEARERYIEEILHHPNQAYDCLICGGPLAVRLFNRRDLEDNPLVEVKAHCSRCLFRL